tara:strand:- start:524 stop:679 length:156 start_codon:yes stop_codon:yes gene_type:complete
MYDMDKKKKKRGGMRKGGMMYKHGGEVNYEKKGDGSAMSAVKAAMKVQSPN